MKNKLILITIMFVFCSFTGHSKINLGIKWELGYSKTKSESPVNYIPATVPGAVQLDIARFEKYPSYNISDHYKKFGWMEDLFYTYRTSFKKPVLPGGERLFFVSKGIDYRFEIYLNDGKIHEQEGMFTYVDIDLTDQLKENNTLKILIYPVPKRIPFPADRVQASNVVKPAVSYTWDWHPRLVPLGIWDETGLEIRNSSTVSDVYMDYQLSDDFKKCDISILAEGKHAEGKKYRWTLTDEKGRNVLSSEGDMHDHLAVSEISLDNPNLWWPYDHGVPYLYTSTFRLLNADGTELQSISRKVGFRRVRLVMNEGAWAEPAGFPKTRSVPPAQFEINGRKIFVKGSNWVNPEIFPGMITKERYEELINLVVEANMNIFRVWGGGIINKESFFEICDEKGIMIWEEFPLACNNYPDDIHYLTILRQEATSIIKRLRKHPCMALWCGGNELFNNWSGMTDQSLALRLLNSLCLEFSPSIPYNPTSPLMGMGHGYYGFRTPEGNEVFQIINNSHFTAYTEFGVPGISPIEVLKDIIPQKDLFPPKPETAWQDHHAFASWQADTWLCQDVLEDYFGKAGTLEELIEQSQLLQSEGYKAIFEEARRQKPYCAMALNWCYNEPWPSAANNSLIVHPAIRKPAYYAVKNACRPLCASARLSKFRWRENEEFFAEAWILNDSFRQYDIGTVKMKLQSGDTIIEILSWIPPTIENNTNIAGPTGRLKLPGFKSKLFKLLIEVENYPEYNSEYTLLFEPAPSGKQKGTPVLND
jgi:beta-mannosidase